MNNNKTKRQPQRAKSKRVKHPKTAKALWKMCCAYFEECQIKSKEPSIKGLAVYCRIKNINQIRDKKRAAAVFVCAEEIIKIISFENAITDLS